MAHELSSCGSQVLEHRLSNCGARAQLLHGMWDLPRPGIEPMSPALAGGFLTTVPPEKSHVINIFNTFVTVQKLLWCHLSYRIMAYNVVNLLNFAFRFCALSKKQDIPQVDNTFSYISSNTVVLCLSFRTLIHWNIFLVDSVR